MGKNFRGEVIYNAETVSRDHYPAFGHQLKHRYPPFIPILPTQTSYIAYIPSRYAS